MKLLDRWGRDSCRVAGSRAAWVFRAAMFAGVTGVVWLAGVADAQADSAIGSTLDHEGVSDLAPVSTLLVDAVAAAPEQAASAPVNQPESVAASILDVPGALFDTPLDEDVTQANQTVVGVADATTNDTDNASPISSTDVTAARSLGAVLNVTRPVTDSLVEVASTITTPMAAVGSTNGRSNSAVKPLSAWGMLTRPAVSMAGQVGGMLLPHVSPSAVAGSPMSVPVVVGEGPSRRVDVVRDSIVRSYEGVASAEQHHVAESERPERPEWIKGAGGRLDSPEPIRTVRYPDPGITATGGVPSGGLFGGCSPYDSAAGRCASDHADRNAQVSRVTPLTAAFGQLPDHVEDPAVSPD